MPKDIYDYEYRADELHDEYGEVHTSRQGLAPMPVSVALGDKPGDLARAAGRPRNADKIPVSAK